MTKKELEEKIRLQELRRIARSAEVRQLTHELSETKIKLQGYAERNQLLVNENASLSVRVRNLHELLQQNPLTKDDDLTAEERLMLSRGLYIDCIKAVRIRLNLGLKEGKDYVDRYRAEHTPPRT